MGLHWFRTLLLPGDGLSPFSGGKGWRSECRAGDVSLVLLAPISRHRDDTPRGTLTGRDTITRSRSPFWWSWPVSGHKRVYREQSAPPEAFLPLCPSSAQNPKPAGLGRARYRGLRQERSIEARDSTMLAT